MNHFRLGLGNSGVEVCLDRLQILNIWFCYICTPRVVETVSVQLTLVVCSQVSCFPLTNHLWFLRLCCVRFLLPHSDLFLKENDMIMLVCRALSDIA